MKNLTLTILLAAMLVTLPLPAAADPDTGASKSQGLSLITANADDGFALAIRLARRSVTTIQTDKSVLVAERPAYAKSADGLIAASEVVAIHFQTIAAANDYWRDARD